MLTELCFGNEFPILFIIDLLLFVKFVQRAYFKAWDFKKSFFVMAYCSHEELKYS